MPPSLGDRLAHILVAIDDINNLLHGRSREDFAADRPRRLAVERAFEIISEASRHVPATVKERESQINWQRSMADLGNWLRHAYHRIDVDILLSIAQNDLPPLKAFVERVIREEEGQAT